MRAYRIIGKTRYLFVLFLGLLLFLGTSELSAQFESYQGEMQGLREQMLPYTNVFQRLFMDSEVSLEEMKQKQDSIQGAVVSMMALLEQLTKDPWHSRFLQLSNSKTAIDVITSGNLDHFQQKLRFQETRQDMWSFFSWLKDDSYAGVLVERGIPWQFWAFLLLIVLAIVPGFATCWHSRLAEHYHAGEMREEIDSMYENLVSRKRQILWLLIVMSFPLLLELAIQGRTYDGELFIFLTYGFICWIALWVFAVGISRIQNPFKSIGGLLARANELRS